MIVFRRRILNAILTVYLPTILVLTIVYATNFFKEFFFEVLAQNISTSMYILTFSGHRVCESDLPPRPHHSVHQRLREPSSDGLHQDGGRVVDICPGGPLGRGASPHLDRRQQDGGRSRKGDKQPRKIDHCWRER